MKKILLFLFLLPFALFGQSKYYLSAPYISGHASDTTNGLMMENSGTGYVGLYLISQTDTIKLHEHPDGYTILDLPSYLSITKNVGIGTTTSTAMLHIAHESGSSALFQKADIVAASSPAFIMQRSRGTIETPTTVVTSDFLGSLQSKGYSGVAWRTGAKIEFLASDVDDDTVAGSILFSTRDTSNTMSERLRIDHFGNVGIGSTSAQALLDVEGNIHGDTLRIDSIWETTLGHGVKIEGVKIYDSIVNSLKATQWTTGYTDLPHEEAKMWWDDDAKTLTLDKEGGTGVRLQVGQEMHMRVYNNSGATITNGKICKLTGAQGHRPTIALAQADTITNAYVLGVATHDIADGSNGYLTTIGLVRDINTTGIPEGEVWTEGNLLYLSPTTPGSMTNVSPNADSVRFLVGAILYAHATEGIMSVRLIVWQRLSFLSDVNARGNQVDGNFLQWSGTNEYWDTVSFATVAGDYQLYTDTTSIDATRYWVGQQGYLTGVSWGTLVGTLSDQTDLQTALDLKYSEISATSDKVAKFTNGGLTLAESLITSKALNVGIGTTNPQAVLEVSGDLLITSNPNNEITSEYIEGYSIKAIDGTGMLFVDDADNYGIRIADGGNVGIGSLDANYQLQVTGTASVSSNFYLSGITLGGASDTLILARSVASGQVFYKNASDIGGGGGGGESNTASNVGIIAGDAGIWFDKSGVDLRFRELNSENNILTIAENDADTVVDFTVNQGNITTINTALSGILLASSGVLSAITDNSANWNTSYGWGDYDGGMTTNYLSKFDGTNLIDSQIFDDATNVGIGDATPTWGFDVNKHVRIVDSVRFDDAYLYAENLIQGAEASGDSNVLVKNSTTGRFMYLNISDVAAGGGGGTGEANTASSQGAGTSIFFQKSGVDLQFNAIKSENSILGVSLDATSHDVELTVDETNIDHNELTNTHNLTTDIDHNTLTNYVAEKHYYQKDNDTVNDALSGVLLATSGLLSVSAVITDNGTNIGIGSATPAQKLDVNGTIQTGGLVFSALAASTNLTALVVDGVIKGNDLSDDFAAIADASKWTTNGNDIYNSNTDNVGIGITNPSQKLYVVGNIRCGNTLFVAGATETYLFYGDNSQDASLNIYSDYDNASRLFIKNDGNIGINDLTPTYKLDVNGTFRAVSASQFDGSLGVTGTLTTETVQAIDGDGLFLYEDGGAGIFIEDGGLVAIGTTDAAAQLHVATQNQSVAFFQRSTDAAGSAPAFVYLRSKGTIASPTASANDDFLMSMQARGYDGSAYRTAAKFEVKLIDITGSVLAGDILFSTRNTSNVMSEVMRITNTANVGIGSTNPASLLDIDGLTTTNTLTIDGVGTAAEADNLVLYVDTDGKVAKKYIGCAFTMTKTSTKFSTTGTYAKLTGWTTDIYDTDCFTWDAGNNELEIDVDGRYMIIIDVYGRSTTVNLRTSLYFTVYEDTGGGFAQNTQYEWYTYVTRYNTGSILEGGLSGTYIADYDDGDKIAIYVKDDGEVLDIEEDDARIYVVKIK